MNKLCVLAKNQETYFIKRLIKEVGQERLVFLNPWVDKEVEKIPEKVLVRTSGVYGSDQDLIFLKSHFSLENIINPLAALTAFRSKKNQYELFPTLEIEGLPWLDLKLSHKKQLQEFLDQNGAPSYLIKPHRGQGGWGIKVMSSSDLLKWHDESLDREFIVQPYVDNACEVRTFFVGDTVINLEREKMSAPGANFMLGGKAKLIGKVPAFDEIINKIRTNVDMVYGSVDALETPHGLKVLEINVTPGIEQVEEVSRVNIIQEILRQIQ